MQSLYVPGTWAVPQKGRYAGDVGLILGDMLGRLEFNPSTECCMVFLPRINLGSASRKKSRTTLHQPLLSETSTNHEQVSSDIADGYSVLKGIGASKRKRASRPPKVLIGRTPITLFAERNNTPLSISSCFYCDEPKSCEHPGKAYKLAGETIVNGLAICLVKFVNLRVATTISDNDFMHFLAAEDSVLFFGGFMQSRVPLPSSWLFCSHDRVFVSPHFAIPGDLNPEVASELQLKKPSEGVIEEIHATDCIVNFLTKDSVEGRQVLIPHLFLLKTMRIGDEVRVLHGSRTFIELGITPNLVDDRISLIDKQGFVVHVHDDVDRVDIKFSEYPNLIAFHPNSLRNITLSPRISLPERPEDIGSVFRWLDPRGTTPEQALNEQATNASTGRQPWIGWSVKIIGNLELKDGIAGQEHKGATGRIVSVDHDDSMLSGLAVGVRLDLRNVPDIRVDYDRIRQSGSGRFLHDNGPKKPPIAFHSYYNFKPSYNPKYSMAELCKLLVDGKRLPELPPEMAELLRKHMVEQEEHNRQKEAAEAQETRCQEADEKAEQRRRVEAEKQQLKRKRKEDEANRQYVSGRSPLRLDRHTPIPEHWITNPLLRRHNPRGVLEVPVYGYEENREVKITAGPNGENLLEYVVKAKGPGGKLPSQVLDEWNIAYDVCSYGFNTPHTCNKLLMIARGPEDHVGRLGRRLYVNVELEIVLQFVRLVALGTNKYEEEILCDEAPVAVSQVNLAVVPEKADEHKPAIQAIKPLQDQAYRVYLAKFGYGLDVEDCL